MRRSLPYYLLSIVILLVLILFVTSLLGGRKSQEFLPMIAKAGIQEELTIEGLRAREGLPAYWLGGEIYQGLPIVDIQHSWDPGSPDGVRSPREYISIIYSSCKSGQPEGGGPGEGYCPPNESPTYVEVRSEWLCLKPPSLFRDENHPPLQVRGAQAKKTSSGSTHFFFEASTVIIFASQGEEITLEAFDKALVGVNPPGQAIAASARAHLGPPMEERCKSFVLPTPQPTATPEPTTTPTATATNAATPEPTTTPGLGGS